MANLQFDQQLQRYGQLELRENKAAYYIRHIPCDKVVAYQIKNHRFQVRMTECKCGLAKKAMQFLLNIIKLMST